MASRCIYQRHQVVFTKYLGNNFRRGIVKTQTMWQHPIQPRHTEHKSCTEIDKNPLECLRICPRIGASFNELAQRPCLIKNTIKDSL